MFRNREELFLTFVWFSVNLNDKSEGRVNKNQSARRQRERISGVQHADSRYGPITISLAKCLRSEGRTRGMLRPALIFIFLIHGRNRLIRLIRTAYRKISFKIICSTDSHLAVSALIYRTGLFRSYFSRVELRGLRRSPIY